MTSNPRDTEFTGLEKDQLRLKEMLCSIQIMYRMPKPSIFLPGKYCLRGTRIKSSSTLKQMLTKLKNKQTTSTYHLNLNPNPKTIVQYKKTKIIIQYLFQLGNGTSKPTGIAPATHTRPMAYPSKRAQKR